VANSMADGEATVKKMVDEKRKFYGHLEPFIVGETNFEYYLLTVKKFFE
jgi:hypothetical protein